MLRRRAELGGWDQAAVALERCGGSDEAVVAAFLAAYERRPSRAEPLLALARRNREQGRYATALLFAERAAALPMPDDALFVQRAAYGWRAFDELELELYYTDQHLRARELWLRALDDGALPAAERERIRANLGYVTAQAEG